MICGTCKIDKPVDNFSWKKKEKSLRASVCKSCHSKYMSEHYLKNKKVYSDRAKAARPALNQAGRQYIINYLLNHPCVDCGESDILVLQFDHKENVGSKAKRVGHFVGSMGKLKAEIEKCDIRCANCHARKSAKEFGWRLNV